MTPSVPTRLSSDLLMHALTYAAKPAQAVAEAARVLRPGGQLLLSSLARHGHRAAVEAYGHVNLGFTEKELRRFIDKAGLELLSSETRSEEHTSELQSLMRSSYAVFCLQKKT